MAKLTWDNVGERYFEAGVQDVVLYPYEAASGQTPAGYGKGVAWNGITAINENPSGGEANAIWADNIKYANIMSAEDFGCTIEAYTYPDEFAPCDGQAVVATGVTIGQQKRKTFGLCYRTEIGSDTEEMDAGYKLHLVYGCLAAPSSRDHGTLNDNPDPETMSWEVSTTPVAVEGFRPTAHLVIDSRTTAEAKMTALKNALYGTDAGSGTEATDPQLLLPDDVIDLINRQ